MLTLATDLAADCLLICEAYSQVLTFTVLCIFSENRAYTKPKAAELFVNMRNRFSTHFILSMEEVCIQFKDHFNSSFSSSDYENEEDVRSE